MSFVSKSYQVDDITTVLVRVTAVDILIVWATIIWMMVAIWKHHKWVAVAQVPYFVWVSIATVLQLSMTWMNW